MSYYGYAPYVPVAQKRRRAQQMAEQMKKTNPDLTPVSVEGRKLAQTWWGQAWNNNLESYSDYANRIGRGRSYLRHGAVLDLKIGAGGIRALVQGSEARPYQIEIGIVPLQVRVWEEIKETCQGKIESLPELTQGKFPKGLAELFTSRGTGLFPSPQEIKLNCSCPDWAVMCKHVAAVLYGVGVRLDQNPELFFTLRGVKIEELISEAIQEKAKTMLGKAERKSRRILDDADVASRFGIEVEAVTQPVLPVTEPPRKRGRKPKNGTSVL